MYQVVKKAMKNEKGLTLIELLAVVVILGIIAAIAIPAIGGLIDNSKKDAHVANAVQMINSARLAVASEQAKQPTKDNDTTITLQNLLDDGYIDDPKDPDAASNAEDKGYKRGDSEVVVSTTDGRVFVYTVTLKGEKREIVGKTEDQLNRSVFDEKESGD